MIQSVVKLRFFNMHPTAIQFNAQPALLMKTRRMTATQRQEWKADYLIQ